MTYSIIKVSNGAYFIHEEGITDIDKAKTKFHTLCASLWNAKDVETVCVMIADENLDAVQGYKEYISHEPAPEEPSEE